MNPPAGGRPPHGGAAPQYVDDPVPQARAVNPYAAPQHWGYSPPQGRGGPKGEWVACPRCQSPYINKATFTWWGGVVGPLIIPEVKCATCGHTYNGKSGGSLAGAIAIYLGVVLGSLLVLAAVGAYLLVTRF